jgi:hypothetical protein
MSHFYFITVANIRRINITNFSDVLNGEHFMNRIIIIIIIIIINLKFLT